MLASAFGFRGRLNRLQYLVSLLILAALVVALSVGAVLALPHHPQAGMAASVGAILIIALLAAPALIWSSFSLQARRFRDMGWSPIFVIPAWIVFGIMDRLGSQAAPSLAVGHSHQTLVGVFVNLALTGCLFFWPSDEGADVSTPPAGDARMQDPAVFAAPSASWNAAPSRASFGRRGL